MIVRINPQSDLPGESDDRVVGGHRDSPECNLGAVGGPTGGRAPIACLRGEHGPLCDCGRTGIFAIVLDSP